MDTNSNANKPDWLISAEQRHHDVVAEILGECHDATTTEKDVEAVLKEIIIPKVLAEFWDKGFNNSATPRYWLWCLDYYLYVHFCKFKFLLHLVACRLAAAWTRLQLQPR